MIHEANPDMKLIALLRNPIDRAYSEWLMWRRRKGEKRTFAECIRYPDESVYVQGGLYAVQLKRYLSLFPREQMFIGFYEAFRSDPFLMTQDIYRFLGVDPGFTPDCSEHHHVTRLPRFPIASGLYSLLRNVGSRPRLRAAFAREGQSPLAQNLLRTLYTEDIPPMPEKCRQRLQEYFAPQNEELTRLLKLSCSGWS
jgi:hypothetical protein